MAARRRRPLILAVSGASGSGKTRLLVRLVPALRARGLRLAALKHSSHAHALDRPRKDSARLRAAGAEAVAVQSRDEMALFGPPLAGARALAALLPPVDLVLAEGWKAEPLPRLEVHRRRVSREFLCATDRRVVAVVTDEEPPRPLPAFHPDAIEEIADFVAAWARAGRRTARRSPKPKVPAKPRR